jgi:ABC-type amino acid transport system permease subunit
MGAGCMVLWIGIPLAWLGLASWLSETGSVVFLVALVACPITMVLWGWALFRLDDLHSQLTGQERPLLEAMLVVTVILAIPAMAIWFFVFAPGQQSPTGPF